MSVLSGKGQENPALLGLMGLIVAALVIVLGASIITNILRNSNPAVDDFNKLNAIIQEVSQKQPNSVDSLAFMMDKETLIAVFSKEQPEVDFKLAVVQGATTPLYRVLGPDVSSPSLCLCRTLSKNKDDTYSCTKASCVPYDFPITITTPSRDCSGDEFEYCLLQTGKKGMFIANIGGSASTKSTSLYVRKESDGSVTITDQITLDAGGPALA